MPYSSVSELPKSVKELSDKKQRQFMSVFNSVYEDTKDEGRAMSAAWSQVKKDVIKAQIASDVYSDRPSAAARSRDLGFGGDTHVHDIEGQAYYMPGASHEEYLEYYSDRYMEEEIAEEVEDEFSREDAIRAVVAEIMNKADVKVGDRVSWGSSGGTARGIVRSIVRDGKVPNIPVKITGSEDEPAARIELVDDEGKPRGEFVGHKVSTLRKSEDIEKAEYQGKKVSLNKPFRLPSGSSKKFGVYVKDGDKVKKVTFGDPNMEIRRDDPDARANFRARHNCDSVSDKTSAAYWSCQMWEKGTSVSEMTKIEEVEDGVILKTDDEERIVWGWASVATKNGEPVVDRQGDVITPTVLVKAANAFMQDVRMAKAMHSGDKVGEVIHSFPITKELGEVLGVSSDREGWIIAMKIHSDEVWDGVKSGKYRAFSIGGKALRSKINV